MIKHNFCTETILPTFLFQLSKQVFTILSFDDNSFVIFKNGGIVPLSVVLDKNKDLKIDDVVDTSKEEIVDAFYVVVEKSIYICLLVKCEGITCFVWTVFLEDTAYQQYNKIELQRSSTKITGYLLCQLNKEIHLLTLCR